MAALQRFSVRTSKSLQPVFPLTYLTEKEKELFKPEVRTSIVEEKEVTSDKNVTSGCGCKCVWCGWPQNQKVE